MKRFAILFSIALLFVSASAFGHGEENRPVPTGTDAADDHGSGHDGQSTTGVAGKAGNVSRTVDITMSDSMRFDPANLAVEQGETIRFVIRNRGQLKHEFVLGSDAELKAHSDMMVKMPGMEHRDPNMVTVGPGKSGEVIWQFTSPGVVKFACLQPGHYEVGMAGKITVSPKTKKPKEGKPGGHRH